VLLHFQRVRTNLHAAHPLHLPWYVPQVYRRLDPKVAIVDIQEKSKKSRLSINGVVVVFSFNDWTLVGEHVDVG
jgi:hypothetical protein